MLQCYSGRQLQPTNPEVGRLAHRGEGANTATVMFRQRPKVRRINRAVQPAGTQAHREHLGVTVVVLSALETRTGKLAVVNCTS
ncbi:hypothetical protein PSPO01_13664 [Paraphaeosphaeria sporulosa]